MSYNNSFIALPVDVSEENEHKGARALSKATLIVLPVGIILGIIFWATAGIEALPWTGLLPDTQNYAAKGQDIAVLTWCITFALSIALMSIRQILLAEEE
ncbi:MAG: hypothetical protein MR006_03820 [Arcanobacterium sp.]|nr:hypothetical protein [Arcanobacterium sp.]MDY5588586.1 hypothetical protein [Arcanobacterium sp.]